MANMTEQSAAEVLRYCKTVRAFWFTLAAANAVSGVAGLLHGWWAEPCANAATIVLILCAYRYFLRGKLAVARQALREQQIASLERELGIS